MVKGLDLKIDTLKEYEENMNLAEKKMSSLSYMMDTISNKMAYINEKEEMPGV